LWWGKGWGWGGYQDVGQQHELAGHVLVLVAQLLEEFDRLLPVLAAGEERDGLLIERFLLSLSLSLLLLATKTRVTGPIDK
jgi:hypothetical protein